MMQVKIYDKHQNKQSCRPNSQCIVLGVHSFASYLSQIQNKKNAKIGIQGNIKHILHNILWNQFYTYTLLKDIQKVIFADAQYNNVFMKIGNKTHRLALLTDWSGLSKIQAQIIKCPIIYIQGFMEDSSVKFLTIQISQFQISECDIQFKYSNKQSIFSQKSARSQQNVQINNYASVQKSRNKSIQNKRTITVKNADIEQTKNKMQYQTQKKSKCYKNQKQQIYITRAQQIKSKTNGSYSIGIQTQWDCNYQRQQLAAHLLHKKQQKLRQYRNQYQQKCQQYESKIQKMQANHNQQINNIKQEINQVLSQYKKKNKSLRKQNECLSEINHKLAIANKKLQETIETINKQIRLIKSENQQLQSYKFNHQVLSEKVNQEKQTYQKQIISKDKALEQIKQKYFKLLGNIKSTAAEHDKQNIY